MQEQPNNEANKHASRQKMPPLFVGAARVCHGKLDWGCQFSALEVGESEIVMTAGEGKTLRVPLHAVGSVACSKSIAAVLFNVSAQPQQQVEACIPPQQFQVQEAENWEGEDDDDEWEEVNAGQGREDSIFQQLQAPGQGAVNLLGDLSITLQPRAQGRFGSYSQLYSLLTSKINQIESKEQPGHGHTNAGIHQLLHGQYAPEEDDIEEEGLELGTAEKRVKKDAQD